MLFRLRHPPLPEAGPGRDEQAAEAWAATSQQADGGGRAHRRPPAPRFRDEPEAGPAAWPPQDVNFCQNLVATVGRGNPLWTPSVAVHFCWIFQAWKMLTTLPGPFLRPCLQATRRSEVRTSFGKEQVCYSGGGLSRLVAPHLRREPIRWAASTWAALSCPYRHGGGFWRQREETNRKVMLLLSCE